MSNNDNNSKKVIQLKKSVQLKQSGLVTDSVYYIDTHDVKISLNHDAGMDIILTLDKKWQNNLNTIVKMAEENGIFDKESKRLLISHLNDNHDEILETNHNNKNSIEEEEESKKKFVTYKYSQMGKALLHEAVIVDGLPFFIRYNNEINKIELLEDIRENSRVLRPPEREEYPYTPYEFKSKEELEFFIEKAKQIISLDIPYRICKSIFSRYIDHDKDVIVLLTADSIETYFQDLFPTTHYTEGVGTNDVGKSSIGYTFEYTGYRVVKATAISGANYYRVLGSIEPGQCVIIEDEGDSISEDPDKVKILKSGYEYNGKIPKINMNTRDQEQKWFKTYCYKMILAEKSLKEYKVKGLVDRTFSFPCRPGKVKYSIKEVVSENIKKSIKLQRLYEELLSFRKLMICYRLIHYKDLSLPEIETGLKNRDNELCRPLLQLFYGTEALKEIIKSLEKFVKQRRTRKGNSIDAALYPIIKKHVFAAEGLNSETNTYSELKEKNKSVKVAFSYIWNSIKGDEIEGHYDEKKNKYEYVTVEFGSLYLNSLPKTISDKFAAQVKKESYGSALIFDVEKLERFEDLYSDSHLNEDNVKIKVKPAPADKNDDYDNSDDFLGVRTNFSEKKSEDNYCNKQGEKEDLDEGGIEEVETELSRLKNNKVDRCALQNSSESSKSSESS
jgi:hypothetical protein